MGSSEQSDTALPLLSSDSAGQRFRLRGEQELVYEILRNNIHPEIAAMYEACLVLLATFEYGEKLSLAAHAVREIFRHTPLKLGIAWPRRQLMNELQTLRGKYETWHPGFAQGGKMPETDPQQDAKLRNFLSYYEYIAKHGGGSAKEKAAQVFQQLMPWTKIAPLQDLAKRWLDAHDFFQKVAHHNTPTTEAEFAAKLREFQICVLATRKPEAIADLDEIDELFGKGQTDG
jgi:hypothetical protein